MIAGQENITARTGSSQRAFLAVLVVTLSAFAAQVLLFITQVVIASLFGAGAEMDAFLAASAVPQYVIAVLIGSLGMVFVPVFIDYMATEREDEAWRVASSVINLTLLALGVLVAVGIWFADLILSLTAPGLPEATHRQAVQIAVITWPSVLATGVISLLTGIYQSQERFGWPAAVPVIGATLNLGLVITLANRFGIIGLAMATTLGMMLQVGLLLPLVMKPNRYRLTMDWRHPAVKQVFRLLLPLVLASLLGKSTPIVDRFLASGMPEGSISHLGYAFRVFSLLSLLLSTGIATVIFPRMAVLVTSADLAALRHTISAGLRVMWLTIAPVMTIGIALAPSLVSAVFERGQFGVRDAAAVAGLLRIYLLALAPACLGNLTGRGFYVLKDTQTIGVLSSIEAVAYVIYTTLLAHFLGAIGVALGYVFLFNGSFLWQIIILRHKTGNASGRFVIASFIRTGLAALLGAAVAWGVTQAISNVWLQVILGGASGLFAYGGGLWVLRSPEICQAWDSSGLRGKFYSLKRA